MKLLLSLKHFFFVGCFFISISQGTFAQIPPVSSVPALNKVVWVWLENTSYAQMILQKYTNLLMLSHPNARFSSYLASSSVTQANVMMMIGGTDFGIQDNALTRIASPTLIDLLESKNITWKVYAEDYPGSCFLNEGIGSYKRYRVPFLSISRVQSDRYQCMNIVSFANLDDDLKYGNLSQFSVVIPNLASSGGLSNAQTADNTLRRILDPIVTNAGLLETTTIIISTTNNITVTNPEMFTMILGNGVRGGGAININTRYSHPNVLRTIEDGLHLGNLNQADASATPMVGFWK